MKVRIMIQYEEDFIPARCKTPRHRICQEYLDLSVREIDIQNLTLAFEDRSGYKPKELHHYDGKLWMRFADVADMPCNMHISLNDKMLLLEGGDAVPAFKQYTVHKPLSRTEVIKRRKKMLTHYLIADGELYFEMPEPMYLVVPHSNGVSFSVQYEIKWGMPIEYYYSALEREQALDVAKKHLLSVNPTANTDKFTADILVYAPKFVQFKHQTA